MNIFLIISFSFLLIYFMFFLFFAIGFLRTKYWIQENEDFSIPITIIICARNEEKNLARLIATLASQQYPKHLMEIIFINDASTDNTRNLAKGLMNKFELNFKYFENEIQFGKKRSITMAIENASSELIVTRDADTFTQSNYWLQSLVNYYSETKSDFIIAPISLNDNEGIFWASQVVENNILALVACGSHYFKKSFLCNGANLAFTKSIFRKVSGYQSHANIASGDDVLFLEDVKKMIDSKIGYIKSKKAMVYTYPHYSFGELLNQKVRWASKFKFNPNKFNFLFAGITFAVNFIWIILFVIAFTSPQNFNVCSLFIGSKIMIDFILILLSSSFIKSKNLLWYSLPVAFIYPIYASLVGILSLFKKPSWKAN